MKIIKQHLSIHKNLLIILFKYGLILGQWRLCFLIYKLYFKLFFNSNDRKLKHIIINKDKFDM